MCFFSYREDNLAVIDIDSVVKILDVSTDHDVENTRPQMPLKDDCDRIMFSKKKN